MTLPLTAKANLLMQYALNYSSTSDDSDSGEFEQSRTFHKIFLSASINPRSTLFFGWNINSWSSALSQGTSDEDTYNMLEMGPRLVWFTNDNYNLYFSVEWNPYANGDRDKGGDNKEITGSSLGFGAGYRFRITRSIGLGASLNYNSLSVKEEKDGSNVDEITESVSNIMPMLELVIITR